MTTEQSLAEDTPPASTPDDTPDAPGTPASRKEAADAPDVPEPAKKAADVPDGGKEAWFGRRRLLGALAGLLVAALAATAALQWLSASQSRDALARLESERALRLEVSGAASSFGKALLSYDYKDLQTTRATLTAQATGDFLATYDDAFGGPMAEVIVKLKAVSQANIREVYLSDVDEATAHAIVVVDQQVTTPEAIRSVKDSHLKISLVKEKGVWKVNDVTVLGAAKEDQYKLDSGTKTKD
ncbi:hypothetical protein [Nonomuraea rhizosphaerae]|uniref:hypothetical protein n=1 Tax=Nonomuraea rhizosphaerae TaxID=2665663 RepID=UPI001C5CDC4D|nr:hypothetical protein [Nonomuraea rhizosphaerae]